MAVEEDELQDHYPSAYLFLSEHKTELANEIRVKESMLPGKFMGERRE